MLSATDTVLKLGLMHRLPVYRYTAALAAGKRDSFFHHLVDTLDDPVPLVQQAARHSLVNMASKKNLPVDFGPLPHCYPFEVELSKELWKAWHSKANK